MKILRTIISGEILQNKLIKENIKFLVLIFFLFFVFVIIGAIGAFKVGEIEELKREISELKEDSIYLSADLMQRSLIYEVNNEIKRRNIDLEMVSEPPKIIEIKVEN